MLFDCVGFFVIFYLFFLIKVICAIRRSYHHYIHFIEDKNIRAKLCTMVMLQILGMSSKVLNERLAWNFILEIRQISDYTEKSYKLSSKILQ